MAEHRAPLMLRLIGDLLGAAVFALPVEATRAGLVDVGVQRAISAVVLR